MALNEGVEVPVIKNLYAEPWKQQYSDLRLSTKPSESCGIAASVQYIAAPWDVGGGGVLGIIRLESIGRNPAVSKIKGHTAPIQDTNFSPFHTGLVATACDDTIVRVWEIPENAGKDTEIKDPVASFTGAAKKAVSVEWNPLAENILASACFDGNSFVWDLETENQIWNSKLPDAVLSMKWSWAGDQLAFTSKDKLLHVFDPRKSEEVASVPCHEGSKAAKCTWVDGLAGRPGHILTTGFSKSQYRECALWDMRKFDTPLTRLEVDRGSPTLYPTFDETLGLVYLTGKGDTGSRYYQFSKGQLKHVDFYRSSVPIKNFCFIPKIAVAQMRAEVGRMLKQENHNVLLPVSFIVPRKNPDIFHADLYPPAPDVVPTLTAGEWLEGQEKPMLRRSIKPGDEADKRGLTAAANAATNRLSVGTNSRRASQSPRDSVNLDLGQLEKLRDENSRLREQLSELQQSSQASADEKADAELQQRLEELESQLSEEKATTEQTRAQLRALEARFIAAVKAQKAAEAKVSILEKTRGSAGEAGDASAEAVVADLKAKMKQLQQEIAELKETNELLKEQMQQAEGTLNRASTITGLDNDMKQELTEMRDFFRDILDHSAER